MRGGLIRILALALGSAVLPGCALLVGAAIGAGVVYAVSEDSVEVLFDAPFDEVFDVCEAQLERSGRVELSDDARGAVEGSVRDSEVSIRIETTRQGLQRVTVTARKYEGLGPDLETAQWLADAISRRLSGR
ncbi:MAG: DUF3568 family protein [Planctomycetota bacterium]|nr:MAG: DUF3568 family protein [Planctomycetota bacterium]